MNLTRKRFLRGLGAGSVGFWAVSGFASEPLREEPAELPSWDAARPDAFWRGVRAQFDLAERPVYLNTGGLGPSPLPVLGCYDATTRKLQRSADAGYALHAEARRALAGFLGASEEEITFTRNATEGNSIVACGLALRAGDEVIFESHAHPGGSLPWLNQAKLRGIVVRTFEPDAGSADGNVRRIEALISPRTRVIQVSHITAPTGIVMPVAAIARLARERGAWFHVDGAQSAGMAVFDLHEIGCDSYATSGHKWLGGPRETGVLYLRADRLDQVVPVHVGAHSSGDFDFQGRLVYSPGAARHEYGTRNAAALAALAEAARFQAKVGRERIAAYGARLARRVQAGITGLKGVSVLTPSLPELQCSIVTFSLAGWPADRLFRELHERHGLRCRQVTEAGLQALRVSTHLFNNEEECDRVVRAVRQLAEAS